MRRLTLAAFAALAIAATACTSPTAPAESPSVNLECKGGMNGSSTRDCE
jgi:hypothetical protein